LEKHYSDSRHGYATCMKFPFGLCEAASSSNPRTTYHNQWKEMLCC
jgi:hypothetical protein